MLASPGKGYSEEPLVQVLDSDKQTVLLALDQRWILRGGLFAYLNGYGSSKRFCNHRDRGLRELKSPLLLSIRLGWTYSLLRVLIGSLTEETSPNTVSA